MKFKNNIFLGIQYKFLWSHTIMISEHYHPYISDFIPQEISKY